MAEPRPSWRPALPYVAPFAALIALLGLTHSLPVEPALAYPLRTVVVAVVLLVFSRDVIPLHATHVLSSVVLGVAVFLVWIGPEALWPGYRSHWLFQNSVTGAPPAGAPAMVRSDGAFWVTAALFAVEHGPYWEGYWPVQPWWITLAAARPVRETRSQTCRLTLPGRQHAHNSLRRCRYGPSSASLRSPWRGSERKYEFGGGINCDCLALRARNLPRGDWLSFCQRLRWPTAKPRAAQRGTTFRVTAVTIRS